MVVRNGEQAEVDMSSVRSLNGLCAAASTVLVLLTHTDTVSQPVSGGTAVDMAVISRASTPAHTHRPIDSELHGTLCPLNVY